jgi:hypothetical protein
MEKTTEAYLEEIKTSLTAIGSMIEAGQRREIQHTTEIVKTLNGLIDQQNLMLTTVKAVTEAVQSLATGLTLLVKEPKE